VVLLILAVLWAVYGVTWYRSRREQRGVNSISSFSHHLSVLERTSPARPGRSDAMRQSSGRPAPIFPSANYSPPRPPMSLSAARRRRRNVLYLLMGMALATLILTPFMGRSMVLLHVLSDALLVAYLALLVRGQRLVTERRNKVRYLPAASPMVAEPQYLLQRSGS